MEVRRKFYFMGKGLCLGLIAALIQSARSPGCSGPEFLSLTRACLFTPWAGQLFGHVGLNNQQRELSAPMPHRFTAIQPKRATGLIRLTANFVSW
jgi:hypothetical protein